MNKAKKNSKIDGKKFLRNAFLAEQEVLRQKLELSSASITHDGLMGNVNEQHFIEILKKYLPRRYAIDSAIVIDSKGASSDQIDIVIYDRHYTPTLLDQIEHRFVPAEAVYAVLEVKPKINKQYVEYASEKAKSVRVLHRSTIPITHAGGEYPAKELFPIISGIVASNTSWKDGFNSQSFKKLYSKLNEDEIINCGLAVSGDYFDTYDNKLHIGSNKNSLAYFIFRLLQKLQSLGTVPAIDWNSYASVLSGN